MLNEVQIKPNNKASTFSVFTYGQPSTGCSVTPRTKIPPDPIAIINSWFRLSENKVVWSALHCTHGAFFIFGFLCWIREGGWGSAAVTHRAKMFSFFQPCSFLIWAKWTSWDPHVSLSQLRACHPCHLRTHNHSVPHQGAAYASSDFHSSGHPLL